MTSPRFRIAFAGTPEFAAVSLKTLLKADHFDVVSIYTQPDKPAGRGRKIRKSAVKELAESKNLNVLQPHSFKEQETLEELRSLKLDLLIVVAYGQILPKAVLNVPHFGCINVHASLLPRWRGAAPIQRSIEAGDSRSGVTIMQMAETLDSGPMYLQASCNIEPLDTAQTLHDKLAKLGAECLLKTLSAISDGTAPLERQDQQLVTYADKILKSEAAIDWQEAAVVIERKIRAFNPTPVAYAELFGKNVRIWAAEVIYPDPPITNKIGKIVHISRQGIDITTGEGLLRIKTLQMPGKCQVSVSDFVNGNPDLLLKC